MTWSQISSVSAGTQFQISDALSWMLPICGALAAIRFLTELDSSFPPQIWEFLLMSASTFTIVVGAMMVAFGSRRHVRSVIFLTIAVFGIGVVSATPKMVQNFQRIGANPQVAVPLKRYAVSAVEEGTRHEIVAFAAMFTGPECSTLQTQAPLTSGLVSWSRRHKTKESLSQSPQQGQLSA